ncbi:MAG: nucleotidyltransferase family protein [Chloroflexi bacterium]|nr:nucleotidyltransferase family protein [Chloroflexota bacterium]
MPAAILLAAGESTRMGEPKQLLDWQGQTLVAAQIETLLEAQCSPVIVVLGAYANRVRPAIAGRADVQITTNPQWRGGRASSIRAGARAVPSVVDSVAVVSVDQPTRAAVVTRLANELGLSGDALIAVPRHEGRNGHPPVFRAELLPELQNVTERQEGIRRIRRRHADRTIFLEMNDPLVTLNLNTPEAYRRAIELL